MESYICIRGKKTQLTDDQVKELGFTPSKKAFDYTADEIEKIVENGEARDHFRVHDVLQICGIELEVIGFDHDTDANDANRHTMTVMEKTISVQRRMHEGACSRGWIDTELRQWAKERFEGLPDELKIVIRSVHKQTHNSNGEAFDTVDELFLPSESELFGSAIWSKCKDGEGYEAFACSDDRVRYDENGEERPYWTRSSYGGNSTTFAYVSANGFPTSAGAASTWLGAPLCFNF